MINFIKKENHKTMLSEEQIQFIVDRVNEKVNVPILGEKAEGKLIRKAVDKVLKCLEENLPEDIFQFIDDLSDGIEPGMDIEEMKDNTVKFLNKEINLPIVGEKFEAKLFAEVVDLIFNAIKKGKKLAT